MFSTRSNHSNGKVYKKRAADHEADSARSYRPVRQQNENSSEPPPGHSCKVPGESECPDREFGASEQLWYAIAAEQPDQNVVFAQI